MTQLTVVKKDEKPSIASQMEEQMAMSVVKKILPMVEPFLKPGVDKLAEWMGDDSKLILIRKISGRTMAIILDISKDKDFKIDKEDISINSDAVIAALPLEQGITDLMTGKLFETK